jgi:hypothetical protein
MAYAGVLVELTIDCPSCQNPQPLNGATEQLLCSSCHQTIETPPALFEMALSDHIPEAVGFQELEGRQSTIMGQWQAKITYGRQAPRCKNEDCKHTFPDEWLDTAIGSGEGDYFCPACGTGNHVRPAPGWFDGVYPGVKAIVGESPAAQATEVAATSVGFRCYHCGGELPLDGSMRQLKCGFCAGDVVVPDDVWARLHPMATVSRWWVLLDLGDAAGVLPEDVWDFVDVGIDGQGNPILAYHDENEGTVGHNCRVVKLDKASGMLSWIFDSAEFDNDSKLYCSPRDGNVVLVDESKGFVRLFDAATGKQLSKHKSPKRDEGGMQLNVRSHEGFAVDSDGSYLVKRDWDDGESDQLRRFTGVDGKRVALWMSPKTSGKVKFDKPKPQPDKLEYRSRFCVGWDGVFYALEKKARKLIGYSRQGQIARQLDTGAEGVSSVEGFGVDRQGNAYVLFDPKEKLGGGGERWSHVARIVPNGKWELWVGPASQINPQPFGTSVRYFAVGADGTLVIGDGIDELRVIGPDGQHVWRAPATIKQDKERNEQLGR